MTLTKKSLNRLEESMWLPMTTTQKEAILQRFGEEPDPYEWTEQDIITQIQNFIGCGEFVKTIKDNSKGRPSTIPPGIDF